jgi:hypothetical protein
VTNGTNGATAGGSRSLVTAVADTVATAPTLALLGTLAGIAGAAAGAGLIRRRRSSL